MSWEPGGQSNAHCFDTFVPPPSDLQDRVKSVLKKDGAAPAAATSGGGAAGAGGTARKATRKISFAPAEGIQEDSEQEEEDEREAIEEVGGEACLPGVGSPAGTGVRTACCMLHAVCPLHVEI